jgi:hypothetical protein
LQLQQKEARQQQQEQQQAWQQQASHQPLQLLDCQSSTDISLSLTHLQITDQQWPGTSQPKLSAEPQGTSAMAEIPMVQHPDHSSSSSSNSSSSSSSSNSSSSKGCAAAVGDQQQLDAAIALLCNCSAVVGMHPDQATEPIVALAVALRRPFAVVPCCVYAAEFPKRKLLSDGSPVKTYEQLVQYIQQLAAAAPGEYRIGVEVMPFEGKNLLVWGMPGHQGHRCHK